MPAISLVTLGVRDVARSAAFYAAIGLRRVPYEAAEVAFFEAGGVVLSLYEGDALARDTGLSDPRPGAVTLAFNVARAEDVAPRLALAVAAGATVLRDVRTMPWGGVTAYFADPDGHPWEITWVDGFALTEDGRIILS